MAGDIEEFLRRAAERRQQRARQRNAQQRQHTERPSAPQYTDRNRERVPQTPIPVAPLAEPVSHQAEPLMAEIIEDDEQETLLKRGQARRIERDAKAAKERSDRKNRSQGRRSEGRSSETGSTAQHSEIKATEELLRMLRSPQGIRQAVLLKEILEPRSNVWD
ncbi:hypothetical protein [Roseimaritima sediminicola]|uniref:hypothetical protein n=1 Tax=Roseimaritima sediminicola TaxID=2662066 RepID=UPI0012984DD8|nr:hypothetical protein [Roseimaritima sediminicola]